MPACRTFPKITVSTSPASTPAAASAARIADEPSCGAVSADREPRKEPIGVRDAERMTTSPRDCGTAVCAPNGRREPSAAILPKGREILFFVANRSRQHYNEATRRRGRVREDRRHVHRPSRKPRRSFPTALPPSRSGKTSISNGGSDASNPSVRNAGVRPSSWQPRQGSRRTDRRLRGRLSLLRRDPVRRAVAPLGRTGIRLRLLRARNRAHPGGNAPFRPRVPARGRGVLRETQPGGALLQACLFPGLEEEIVVYQAQRLAEKIVRRSVAAGIAGAFYLKEVLPRGGVREAVGRDDRDLRRALLSRCGGSVENVLFGWTVAGTALEAYRHGRPARSSMRSTRCCRISSMNT